MPYARSDLAYVFVSQAHGGCGKPHSRPVEQGAPAKIWEERCPACSDFLRSDSNWSTTLSELPETHDEKIAREDFDKRGARDRDQILALALAKLANVELPETLLRPLTGNMPHTAAALTAGTGDATAALQARIAELEQALLKAAEAAPAPPVAAPEPEPHVVLPVGGGGGGGGGGLPGDVQVTVKAAAAPAVATEREPTNREIRDMKRADLVTLAKSRGLQDTGSRADLIGRLLKKNGNGS